MHSSKTGNNNKNVFAVALLATFFMAGTPAWADLGHGKSLNDAIGQEKSKGTPAHNFAFGKPDEADNADRTINIVMNDNFFEQDAISVKAGETVRFKIVNKGEFLHEFGLGTSAMHSVHQKQMATMMKHGMIRPTRIDFSRMNMKHGGPMMAHNDPNSILLEPGQSGEIVWKFTRAMKLEFACNLPGHYESGMMGEIKFN